MFSNRTKRGLGHALRHFGAAVAVESHFASTRWRALFGKEYGHIAFEAGWRRAAVHWSPPASPSLCVCVKKYAQTFVIYVIRSVNRMMAARRIGFTLLKTLRQAKLHRGPVAVAIAVAIAWTQLLPPLQLLFIGVKLGFQGFLIVFRFMASPNIKLNLPFIGSGQPTPIPPTPPTFTVG